MQRNIYIALPAYGGTVRVETTACLLDASHNIAREGWGCRLRISAGDSILPRCRNALLADFWRRQEFTDLVFIDHDLSLNSEAFTQLLKHDVDLVGGAYRKKHDANPIDPDNWAVAWKPMSFMQREGLVEVDGLPGGFLRITREGVRRMIEAYPQLHYRERGNDFWSLFEFERIGGKYMGEDFVFCKRWQDAGGTVWLDPNINFGHHGHKEYEGCIADFIEARSQIAA